MKIKMQSLIISIFSVYGLIVLPAHVAAESATTLNQGGTVKVQASEVTSPLDPENPENVVNPGEGPSTVGDLRIDYISPFNFGEVSITEKNRRYNLLAQNFHDQTSARGNYIQVSNFKGNNTGWTLQLKQTSQFKNEVIQEKSEHELNGAVLSLDKGWANSVSDSKPPIVTRNAINIDKIGDNYEIATAEKGTGQGTWLISFGASDQNKNGQESTLKKLVDDNGKDLIDPVFNKNMYSNSAVSLKIPDKTKIYPLEYQTVLTWTLGSLP